MPSSQEFKYEGKHQVKIIDKEKNEFFINIKVEKIDNQQNAIPQERAGKRLLIGKCVILDRKRASRVLSFNKDGSTNIQVINNNEIIQNVTPNRLRLIEHSGVNVYDISNLPNSIANSQFAWAVQFTTKEKRLLNTILTGIQERTTSMQYDFKTFQILTNEKEIQGQLYISIISASNLHAKGECNPYVQFKIDQQGEQQFQTEVEYNTNSPSWINERSQYGNLFNLGQHQKSNKGKVISFQIKNKTLNEGDQDLGNASVEVHDLLDIKNIAKQISLVVDNKQRYGFLVIQSLFIPVKNTRMKFELQEDLTIFTYPEQYLHYLYLLKSKDFDQYGYQIPIAQYQPNILQQQFTYSLQQSSDQLNSPLILQSFLPDIQSSPLIIQTLNKFSTYEEQLFKQLKQQNANRPQLEEGLIIFKYLWRNRVISSKQVAKLQLQNQFWNHLIQQIQHQETVLETIENIGQEIDILDYIDKRRDENQLNVVSPLKNLFASGSKQSCKIEIEDRERQDKIVLMFRGIWNKGEQEDKYADVYYLIQRGIPSELRPTIWQDLLNVPVIEYEERQLFQKHYGMNYNRQKSLYQNFQDYSAIHDCLAFRQIDEDIKDFVFTKYYLQEKSLNDRIISFNEQKRQIRNILKATIMWSKNKTHENKPISYCYSKGMLSITQRLLTICSEEQSFWVLNGIIRSIPRLFSTSISCLEGGRQSVMRNEMTIFKAILKENLPEICQKLQIFGLALDILIYDSITSFYSGYFSSEICLRIWDLIIFNLSNKDKEERKRAIWQLLAPAYIVIRDSYEDFLEAKSIKEIVQVYQRGCSISYNPDWFISEIKQVTRDIFVIGARKGTQSLGTHRRGNSSGKFSLGEMIKRSLQYDQATLLETTRKTYEQDLTIIFNSIQEENKEIGRLIQSIKYQSVKGQIQYLNYYTWRTHIMDKFKKVAIKNSDEVVDDLYEYDEPDLQRKNLDLSKINIYLHQLSHLSGISLYKLRITYGSLEFDGTFQSIEIHSQQDVYSQQKLQQFHIFDYMNGYNHIKIELYQPSDYEDYEEIDENIQVICETIIDLREINANKFVKKWILMSNEKLLDNPETFRFPFTKFEISLFLQTHTSSQHEEMMHNRNIEISQFINSIKRKLPDKIDVFNKKHDSSFAQLMQGDFQRIIQEELNAMKCFLPLEQANNTINDMYNYIEDSNYGDIRYDNFEYLIEQCFFKEWNDKLKNVYKLFTRDNSEEQKNQDIVDQSQGGTQIQGMIEKIRAQVLRSPRQSQQTMLALNPNLGQSKLPFSLRNFIVSLTLMSHCTLNEKLDILYDLFDWNDGVADGLDLNSITLLVNTIFERNLYYWSSHELFNLIEFSFDSDVSMVYQAFWSREIHINKSKTHLKFSEINSRNINAEEVQTIDITKEIQETINSYQHMFGNKIIDFNYDTSPFKNIEMLIKGGKNLAQMNGNLDEGMQKYRLVLHCLASAERFTFEVKYSSNGLIEQNNEIIEKGDIDEYLKRNVNKLYLQGRTKGITKREFLLKTASIPFLQDLIRVETLYRDRVQNTLAKKKRFPHEILVLLTVDKYQFIFRFQPKVMANIDGEIDKLDSQTFRIKMTCLYTEDVVSDIRQRIINVLVLLFQNNKIKLDKSFSEQTLNAVKGQYDFIIYDQQQSQFKQAEEFDRIVRFSHSESSQVLFKMVQSRIKEDQLDQEVRNTSAYDCYSLYKHSDNTFEWRLCRITRKFPIKALQQDKSIKFNEVKFHYWVEFLHLAEAGQKMWFKRKRTEILMSARYSREQKRNYQKEVLQFIKETYQK